MFGFRNPVGSTHNPNILVTEGDTWTGFYAAWSLLRHHRGGHDSIQGTPASAPTGQPGITPTHHGHVNKVIVGVRDSNSDFAKELHKLGAELREYDPYNMDKDQIQKHLLRNDVDGVAFVPVHDSIGHMININKMLLRAFEEEERCKCLVMWSSIGTQIHPGSGHDDDEDVLAKSKGKSTATRTSATGGGMPSWGQLFENKSQIERAVRNSKFEHECILRIGFVSQQFFGLSNVIQSRGMFPVTSRSNKWAPINAKDVAMVSGALLANPSLMSKFTKQTLVLTGPQSHSGKDMVTVINSTLNAKLSLEEVSLKDLETILLDQEDVPNEGELAMTLGYYHYIKENKLDIVSNDANKVLGRVPSDIDVFFKENGNLFRPRRNVNATPYLKDLKQ